MDNDTASAEPPVYLVTWNVPNIRRDAQRAAAAVGFGQLLTAVSTALGQVYRSKAHTDMQAYTLPAVALRVLDTLEPVNLVWCDAAWDGVKHAGSLYFSLDHPSWGRGLAVVVDVPFCPGCLGSGGAHADGCWGLGKVSVVQPG